MIHKEKTCYITWSKTSVLMFNFDRLVSLKALFKDGVYQNDTSFFKKLRITFLRNLICLNLSKVKDFRLVPLSDCWRQNKNWSYLNSVRSSFMNLLKMITTIQVMMDRVKSKIKPRSRHWKKWFSAMTRQTKGL